MKTKTLSKDELTAFVSNLVNSGRVVGVRRKENKFAFGEIKDTADLVLDYDVTVTPPKAFFQPPREKILDFDPASKDEARPCFSSEPFILFGIHIYDLKALNQMDRIWVDENADEHYLSRRRAATIIALTPKKASKWSFWAWMDSTDVNSGFDLLLTDIGNKYIVEIGTKKGTVLLKKHARDAKDAGRDELKALEKIKIALPNLCSPDRAVKASPKEITELVRNNVKNPVWEEQAKKCYSCGSCNLVCPTCYCFDVKDDLGLDLKKGWRDRTWDGCLLQGFAAVGSGENFREHRSDRFRHRILRKTVFVADKLGELACVGCGRCSEACLPNITDPVFVINKIAEGN